jgi:purine-binding chemotaxis protein CheW
LESAPDPHASRSSVGTVSIVPFAMDGHRFGMLAKDVREVVRAATPSPLPGAPAVVLGVLNVRGELVPVLDVRSRFGLKPRALVHTDHILIVHAAGRLVALAVEAADVLVELPAERIEDAPAYGEHVAGVAKLEDGTLVIYDLTSFLSAAEGAQLETALGAPR